MTSYMEAAARIAETVSPAGGGKLPVDEAAAWSGYIAALLEWGHLSVEDHRRLVDLLGSAAAAAVIPIFLGNSELAEDDSPIELPAMETAVGSGTGG
jgi:hypothetical protein